MDPDVLASLFEINPDGIAIADELGRYVDVNPAYCRMFGYAREELIGRTFGIILLDEEKGLEAYILELALTQASDAPNEWRVRHRDGRTLVVQSSFRTLLRGDGTARILTILSDITPLQQTIAQLTESEQRLRQLNESLEEKVEQRTRSETKFRRIHESMRDAFVLTDLEGGLLEFNQAFCAMLGYSEPELRQMNYRDLLAGRWRGAHARIVAEQILAQGQSELCEHEYIGKARGVFPVELRMHLLRDADGRPEAMWAVVRDVSERKRAEATLRANEAMLHELFSQAPLGIWMMDRNGRIFDCNEKFAEYAGAPRAKILGFNMFSDARDRALIEPIRRGLAGETTAIETEYTSTTGARSSNYRYYFKPVFIDKEFAFLLSFAEDISQRKEAELALKASLGAMRSILATALDGFWITDREGRLLDVNPSYVRQSGYSREELLAMRVGDLEARESHEEIVRHMAHVIAQGGDLFETLHRRKDGSIWNAEVCVTYDPDPDGRFFVFVRDISERKLNETRLEHALDGAQAATRAKSAFLAHMSHEIRTPMNAVVGLAQLMARSGLNPRQADYVERLQRASRSLLAIVSDILDFSKIEAGQVQLEAVEFDLDRVFDDLACVAAVGAQEKRIEINFDLAADLPRRLVGDTCRLEQVLNNLLSNAIKFTAEGEITLQVTNTGETDGRIGLRFVVSDTGIGIAQDRLESIFDAFTQGDDSTTRLHGGSGLGLSISRYLAALMDGELTAFSAPGQGSAFVFTGRFVLAPDGDDDGGIRPLAGRVVAHLDPNATTRRASAALLRSLGAEVVSCATWDELPMRADLLLVDADSCVAAMQGDLLRPNRPFVLTIPPGAGDVVWDLIEVPAWRPAGHLLKPLTRTPLIEVLRQVLDPDPADPVPPDSSGVSPLAGRRVLMVEDNPINRQVLREILEQFGLEVDAAIDGEEAIGRIRDGADFHAILMDLQMPGMGGLEATRAIRALPGAATLPIIAITANVLVDTAAECRAAGMNDYLGKPIQVGELHGKLCRWICGEASAVPPAVPGSPVDAGDRLPDVIPGIDRREVEARVRGSARALADLLDRVCAWCEGLPQRIRAHLDAGERNQAAQIAHDLIGVLSTVGATEMIAAARQLDAAIRAGRLDGAVIGDLLARIEGGLGLLADARRLLLRQSRHCSE